MRVEQVLVPIVRTVAKHQRVSKVVFGVARTENPFAPEFYVDPYPRTDKLWENGPVFFHKVFGQWIVMGYDETHELLRSSDTAVGDVVDMLLVVRPYSKLSPVAKSNFRQWVLLTDPPDHTRSDHWSPVRSRRSRSQVGSRV